MIHDSYQEILLMDALPNGSTGHRARAPKSQKVPEPESLY